MQRTVYQACRLVWLNVPVVSYLTLYMINQMGCGLIFTTVRLNLILQTFHLKDTLCHDTIYGLAQPVAYQNYPYIPESDNRYADLANKPLKPESQFANCNIYAYKDAKDAFVLKKSEVTDLENEIEALRKERGALNGTSKGYYQISNFEKYRGGYICKQGYCEANAKAHDIYQGKNLKIGKPKDAKKGQLYKKGVQLYTWQETREGGRETWLEEPPRKYEGGWDLYEWEVPIEESNYDPERDQELKDEINEKKAELKVLKEELKPLESAYRSEGLKCGVWTAPGDNTGA